MTPCWRRNAPLPKRIAEQTSSAQELREKTASLSRDLGSQDVLLGQKFLYRLADFVFPFGQLALEAVIAAGHGDELANIAARDEFVTQRDRLAIRHGRIGVEIGRAHV